MATEHTTAFELFAVISLVTKTVRFKVYIHMFQKTKLMPLMPTYMHKQCQCTWQFCCMYTKKRQNIKMRLACRQKLIS